MAEQIEFDQAHQALQEVSEALENGRFVHVRRQLQDMEPEDIAHLLEASPRKSREVLWQLTDPEDYGEILDELSADVKDSLVSKMAPEDLAEATEGMDTDDVAYVLRSLPDNVSREVLAQMDAADRLRVETALSYSEDTAGGLMNTDVITIRGDVDVDVVLRYLRMKGELPENTDALYVIDEESRLIGELPISILITTQPDVKVSEVWMTPLRSPPVTQMWLACLNVETGSPPPSLMKTNIWLVVSPSMTSSTLFVKMPNTR